VLLGMTAGVTEQTTDAAANSLRAAGITVSGTPLRS
jgi:hypothetical protein